MNDVLLCEAAMQHRPASLTVSICDVDHRQLACNVASLSLSSEDSSLWAAIYGPPDQWPQGVIPRASAGWTK